jgi:serine/threonine-protein kinase
MSRDSDDLVQKLIESAADGTEINWDEVDQLIADPDLHRLLQHLRVVAGVGDLHRSHVDQFATPPPAAAAGVPQTASHRVDAGAPHASEAVATEGIGRWGHLLLVRKIGEGAFGQVYHAHDTWLDHPVALKLLKPNRLGRDFATRMLHEARKLARVRHPNVVTIHGADNHDGRVGFWMDLVEGRTLADLVAQGRLSHGEAVHMGQELCLALAAVHGAKLVHRDVKAQNVMRASDGGRIILMDFGAGEFIDQAGGGPRIGTPLYLAPELLAGGVASVRSDIYALGVLLFFLVTGTFPVQGGSLSELADAHTARQRRRLRDVRPDLPDFFVSIVERALASDPARRYGSAGQMHAALAGEPASGEVVVPTSHVPAPHAMPPGGRRWLTATWWAAGAFAALTLTGFITSTGYYVALGFREPFLDESALTWPSWGLRAIFPGAVLVGAVGGLSYMAALMVHRTILLVRPEAAARIADRVRRAATAAREAGPETVGPALFILHLLAIIAIWRWFSPLLASIDGLISQTAGVDLTPLSPRNIEEHRLYRMAVSLVFYTFAIAWTALILSKVRRRIPGGWVSIAAGVTLTVVTLILTVIPYRILSHNTHQSVLFHSERCYLLGEREDSGLVFCPRPAPPRTEAVWLDDLVREGPVESVFSAW